MSTPASLRIGIDARLIGGVSGGLEQVIIGLAHGLSQLRDGDETYVFLTLPGTDSWLSPYLGGSCETLSGHASSFLADPRFQFLQATPLLGPLLSRAPRTWNRIISEARLDVMHLTLQRAFYTKIPSIYHPHDLQHRHLPEYFTFFERIGRDLIYKSHCRRAKIVAVTSSWGRRDLITQYKLRKEKVRVINWAPPSAAYSVPSDSDIASAISMFSLPEKFILYPAQTWPHKNHLNLLEAISILRDKNGWEPPLVCTGRQNTFYDQIAHRVEQLGLKTVRFLDFVTSSQLQCLYRAARCVVIPTRFEAASGPVWEAFLAKTPVACSNVTSLPDQVGDAALVFDPDRPEDIANAISRLWVDDELCATLAAKGSARVKLLSWARTAKTFRAHYRRLGGRQMSAEDHELLSLTPSL